MSVCSVVATCYTGLQTCITPRCDSFRRNRHLQYFSKAGQVAVHTRVWVGSSLDDELY